MISKRLFPGYSLKSNPPQNAQIPATIVEKMIAIHPNRFLVFSDIIPPLVTYQKKRPYLNSMPVGANLILALIGK